MGQKAIHLPSVDLCDISVAPVEAVGAEVFEYFDITFRVLHWFLQVTVGDTIIMAVLPLLFVIVLTPISCFALMISLLSWNLIQAERIACQTRSLALLRGGFASIEFAGTYRVA